MTTDQDLAIQLLTASLAYRTTSAADPYTTPEYATYLQLLEELAENKRAAGVLIEMTQFAGTAITRMAQLRDQDPVELWRAIALVHAQDDDNEDDD